MSPRVSCSAFAATRWACGAGLYSPKPFSGARLNRENPNGSRFVKRFKLPLVG